MYIIRCIHNRQKSHLRQAFAPLQHMLTLSTSGRLCSNCWSQAPDQPLLPLNCSPVQCLVSLVLISLVLGLPRNNLNPPEINDMTNISCHLPWQLFTQWRAPCLRLFKHPAEVGRYILITEGVKSTPSKPPFVQKHIHNIQPNGMKHIVSQMVQGGS